MQLMHIVELYTIWKIMHLTIRIILQGTYERIDICHCSLFLDGCLWNRGKGVNMEPQLDFHSQLLDFQNILILYLWHILNIYITQIRKSAKTFKKNMIFQVFWRFLWGFWRKMKTAGSLKEIWSLFKGFMQALWNIQITTQVFWRFLQVFSRKMFI